ncbi:hypothetical protein GWK87_03400 [Staphylococcus schleiferi subsp. coagulans]|uniref:PepSY domain-containing protein n=1 Tax=Staphylococcus coagulans TaxID=74706 RepID=UPI0015FD91E7|nr:PepSY domain-containing protein [Staphylococcus coagulans]MBA8759374.1 hypothetical protein [Staphylococcus coagulans]MBA8767846.1 hypothetical protein [Staphylococcus coagulans]
MRFKVLSLLLSTGVVLAACGHDDQDDHDDHQEHAQRTEQKSDNQSNASSQNMTTQNVNKVKTQPEDAIKTAQKSFDGDVKKIEYKNDHGEWVYEIGLFKGNKEAEIKVSDKDNKVIHKEQETEHEMDNEKAIQYQDAISFKEAVQKAQKKYDGDLKQWQLNQDDGQFVYEIELSSKQGEQEITLDAKSGDVLKQDKDN